jgi:hypothetical protein
LTEMPAVMRRAAVREGGAILTVDALITDLDVNEAMNSGLVSGPVKEREDLKKVKYEPLLSLLKLLKVIGRRDVTPTFFAPSFSSSGEFSDGVFKLCEVFIPTVYRKAVDKQSYSGVTPKEAAREFRQFYYKCTAASLAKLKCNASGRR